MPMMPMQMSPPSESSWEEIFEQLKIRRSNMAKELALIDSQIKEAESHIKNKK